MPNRLTHFSARLTVALLFPLLSVTAFGSDQEAPVSALPGVWHTHQLRFNYLGVDPTYSCDGLERVLKTLLRTSGAGSDMKVSAFPCPGGPGRPTKLLTAELKFTALQPTADASGEPTTPGAWHHVMIRADQPTLLSHADCELVDQFRSSILPAFATRNVTADLRCAAFQTTGYLYSLSFDVFAPRAMVPNPQ
jgi:hypothetical protein